MFGGGQPDGMGTGAATFLSRDTGFDSVNILEKAVLDTRQSVQAIVSALLSD